MKDNLSSDKVHEIGGKGTQGGHRSAVISPAVDELIKDHFLDTFKTGKQISEELKRRTIPVADIDAVNEALKRRVPKTLDRIKDENRKWVYRVKRARLLLMGNDRLSE